MTYSTTNTHSNSYSESRARYVVGKIYDDFHAIFLRGFSNVKKENLEKWRDDVLFVMNKQVLEKFELQFTSGTRKWGLVYEVSADGTIQIDSESGGTNFWALPVDSEFNIVLRHNQKSQEVKDYLNERGWTSTGKFIDSEESGHGGFSKDGYGVYRKIKGEW